MRSEYSKWFWSECDELNKDTSFAHSLAEKAWDYQQSKVDELQAKFDQHDQWLGQRNKDVQELYDIIVKHAAEKGELQKRVDALALALDQIAYPIPHMQKEADLNGCELNGYWAVKMSEDHTYSKDIARRALEKEQALKGGGE